MAAVRDAGHEIGLHGYSHENPSSMTVKQQKEVLDHTHKVRLGNLFMALYVNAVS